MSTAAEMYDADYEKASATEKREFKPIPTGTYPCELIEFSTKETQTGRDMFKCVFNIIAGPFQGKKLFKNMVINAESPDVMKYLKADMANLGLKDYKLSQILTDPGVRMLAIGKQFNVYTKIKYNNQSGKDENAVYINGMINENSQKIAQSARPSQVEQPQNSTVSTDEPPF